MGLKSLIKKNRSHRRFFEHTPVKRKTLEGLIDLARFSASAGNKQSLKYFLSYKECSNSLIFSTLNWAGCLEDWKGPEKGERPPAYIIVLNDKGVSRDCQCDTGIAIQNILLGATEVGLGGCILGPANKENLRKDLGIRGRFEILFVLAIGKPRGEVIIEEVEVDGNSKYWQDNDGIFHVFKRRLEDIIIN